MTLGGTIGTADETAKNGHDDGCMNTAISDQDFQDIALAHKYRLSLTTLPTQSSFRVVALVFYQCTTTSESSSATHLRKQPPQIGHEAISTTTTTAGDYDDDRQLVVGTNDEPGGFIGGSICAERAALVQLRFVPFATVNKIVIVTDHEHTITPGMLCREFMAGHSCVPWDVSIVLAGSGRNHNTGQWNWSKTTLRQLYPYPSPYARLTASQAEELFATNGEVSTTAGTCTLPEDVLQRLLTVAKEAAQRDTRMGLHPIQFGAAVLFDDGAIQSAHQIKMLEYGSTLDAVSQLASDIQRRSHNQQQPTRPLAIVQVDSRGIAHAPFAPARAFLSEHGYGDCIVLVHDYGGATPSSIVNGKLVQVAVANLAPAAPNMGNLWQCS